MILSLCQNCSGILVANGHLQLLQLPVKRLQSLCWFCCKLSAPLPPQACWCKLCGSVPGPVWLQTSHHHSQFCCGLVLLWGNWWNATLSSGCGFLTVTHLHRGLWYTVVNLSTNLLLLLGYICFWVGELFSWALFSHYVQSKQGQCNDIAASAVNTA